MRFTSSTAVVAAATLLGLSTVNAQSSSSEPSRTTSYPSSAPSISAAVSSVAPTPSATPFTGSLSFASTGPSAVALASIIANAPTAVQNALHPNLVATPGAVSPVKGAPVLPSFVFTQGTFPALDMVPPTDSPQVQGWIQQVANSGVTIPSIAQTVEGGCAANAAAAADTSRCWWTCGGCARPADLTTCPDKLTWGVSFDDGPSPYTPDLLNFMDDVKIKSTFFIVGSRAISRPEILQAEYMAGHQLSVHTWSHTGLTLLTNDQIIAELGWTREAIRQITGVSPNTYRPPYGDVDDRVRAIAQAMGMTTIIWTSTTSGANFDTEDWHIPGGQGVETVVEKFNSILSTAGTLTTGFIVLAHDLYQQTVELATGYTLPDALARRNPQFNLVPIVTCQKKTLESAYMETNTNATVNSSSVSRIQPTATLITRASAASASASASTRSGAGSSIQMIPFGGVGIILAGLFGLMMVM